MQRRVVNDGRMARKGSERERGWVEERERERETLRERSEQTEIGATLAYRLAWRYAVAACLAMLALACSASAAVAGQGPSSSLSAFVTA